MVARSLEVMLMTNPRCKAMAMMEREMLMTNPMCKAMAMMEREMLMTNPRSKVKVKLQVHSGISTLTFNTQATTLATI